MGLYVEAQRLGKRGYCSCKPVQIKNDGIPRDTKECCLFADAHCSEPRKSLVHAGQAIMKPSRKQEVSKMKSDTLLKFALTNSLLALSISNVFAAAGTPVVLTTDAVNDATLLEVVDAKAGRVSTLRAQILLDRAHFSPGEIDAAFGGNMRKAITAYQTKA